jgi:hypothetical protein
MEYRCICGQRFNESKFYQKHKEKCQLDIPAKMYSLHLYIHCLDNKCNKLKKYILSEHSRMSILSNSNI